MYLKPTLAQFIPSVQQKNRPAKISSENVKLYPDLWSRLLSESKKGVGAFVVGYLDGKGMDASPIIKATGLFGYTAASTIDNLIRAYVLKKQHPVVFSRSREQLEKNMLPYLTSQDTINLSSEYTKDKLQESITSLEQEQQKRSYFGKNVVASLDDNVLAVGAGYLLGKLCSTLV